MNDERGPLPPRILAAARDSGLPIVDAGRGQPDWIALAPREAFFRLGQFAVSDAQQHSEHAWGLTPPRDGIAGRLDHFLDSDDSAGAHLLRRSVALAEHDFGFDSDAFVHDLVVAILGARYPSPNRFTSRLETITGRYLARMAGLNDDDAGQFEIFATEGGAAAMAYIFKTLRANDIVGPDDAIAILTPVFTPYLQIPVLENYGFRVVPIQSAHNLAYRLTDDAFSQLRDPSIKVLILINPGNPDTRAIRSERLDQLVLFVNEHRPDLVIVADTAYATFVEDFHGVFSVLPHNTILLHSFSKNYGATGNRLGFIALRSRNVLDEIVSAQRNETTSRQQARYGSVTADVASLSFMARVVAESREVALHNIAGLSTVDQVQLALFALDYLTAEGQSYIAATRTELSARADALFGPLGVTQPGGRDSHYYALIDVLEVARHRHGEPFRRWMEDRATPEEIPLRLARSHGVVLQPGSFFHSQEWDIRISLASLPASDHHRIAHALLEVLDELHSESKTA